MIKVNDAPFWFVDLAIKADATEEQAYTGQTLAGGASEIDADDTLTYKKTSGTTWLIVASDGALSGTPQNSDAGLNSFTE